MPSLRREALRNCAAVFAASGQHKNLPDLMAVKGVGQWTCDYVSLRGFSEPDIYLQSDLVVRKTVTRYALTPEAAAPWQSYLTLQLWHLA